MPLTKHPAGPKELAWDAEGQALGEALEAFCKKNGIAYAFLVELDDHGIGGNHIAANVAVIDLDDDRVQFIGEPGRHIRAVLHHELTCEDCLAAGERNMDHAIDARRKGAS